MKITVQLLFALFLIIGINVSEGQAQGSKPEYRISGKVLDKSNNQPVAYAVVSLVDAETRQNVAGAVADFDGVFIISGFKNGNYLVQVSFMGFQAITSATLEVTDAKTSFDLGSLSLEQEAVALQEVIVMGQRDLIEEKVDRTIYNAENDKTLVGGDASDVLRRVPMLSVDMDGNVSMRGSSSILVLLNGKQSAIVATNVA